MHKTLERLRNFCIGHSSKNVDTSSLIINHLVTLKSKGNMVISSLYEQAMNDFEKGEFRTSLEIPNIIHNHLQNKGYVGIVCDLVLYSIQYKLGVSCKIICISVLKNLFRTPLKWLIKRINGTLRIHNTDKRKVRYILLTTFTSI